MWLYSTKAPQALLATLIRRSTCVHGRDLICDSVREHSHREAYIGPWFFQVACGRNDMSIVTDEELFKQYHIGEDPAKKRTTTTTRQVKSTKSTTTRERYHWRVTKMTTLPLRDRLRKRWKEQREAQK